MVPNDTARPLVLAFVVLLAGCGGLSFGSEQTETLTPAPVPESDPGATQNNYSQTRINDSIVTNQRKLAQIHLRTLSDNLYTYQQLNQVRTATGVTLSYTTVELAKGEGATRIVVKRLGPNASSPQEREIYRDSNIVERVNQSNETKYRTLTAHQLQHRMESLPNRRLIVIHLLSETVDLELVRRGNETTQTRYQLVASEVAKPDQFAQVEGNDPVRDLTLRVHVDKSGFIQKYEYSYITEINEQTVRIIRTGIYTEVGATTVDQPEWYELALANSSGHHRVER